jgi:hypothetical protein
MGDQRQNRLQTVFHDLYRSGRSRHAVPVLAFEQHSVDHPPVIHPQPPCHSRGGQQRLNHLPLLIGQLMPAHRSPASNQTTPPLEDRP